MAQGASIKRASRAGGARRQQRSNRNSTNRNSNNPQATTSGHKRSIQAAELHPSQEQVKLPSSDVYSDDSEQLTPKHNRMSKRKKLAKHGNRDPAEASGQIMEVNPEVTPEHSPAPITDAAESPVDVGEQDQVRIRMSNAGNKTSRELDLESPRLPLQSPPDEVGIEESPPCRTHAARKITGPAFDEEDSIQPDDSPADNNRCSDYDRVVESPLVVSGRPMFNRQTDNNQDRNAVLNVQSSALQHFVDHIEKKIATVISGLESKVMEKLRELDQEFGNVRNEIMELRAIGGNNIVSGSAAAKRTPLAVFEEKLDHLTPHAAWIFDTPTVSRLLSVAVCHCIISTIKLGGTLHKRSAEGVHTLLFAKQPGQKKSTYHEGIGREHSLFRLMIVKNALFNVQRNVFERFKPLQDDGATEIDKSASDDSREAGAEKSGQVIREGELKLNHPDWLRPGVVQVSDVEDARRILEFTSKGAEEATRRGAGSGARGRPPKIVVKEIPTNRDISLHGAVKVYRIVTKILHDSREKAKSVLAEELTYIMATWASFGTGVDQSSMKVRWVGQPESLRAEMNISEVPKTAKNPSRSVRIDQANDGLYKSLLTSFPEMIISVQHDVYVVGNPQTAADIQPDIAKKSRKRQGGEKTVLKRLVNLIEVAAKFCVAYTQASSKEYTPEQFLRSNVDALRAIGAVATLLRLFLKKFMALNLDTRGRLRGPDIDLANVKVGSLALEALIPGNSLMKRVLNSRALRLTQQEFDVLNVTDRLRRSTIGAGEDGISDGVSRDITACEADGIMEV